ncbi:hypothetical protein PVAP13_6KG400901, partial [Panicum virgatum]
MDRISALPDELLHIILGLVGDALAVTRTAALSRRWRHVWVHAKSLTIDAAAPGRFVDWVLSRRADQDMGSLQIRISPRGRARTSPEPANGWLRYAARRVVGPFALRFRDSARTTSIEMDLSNGTLRLLPPASAAAAAYESLTALLPQDGCLASVRRLNGISVDMHGKYYRGTYVGLDLMEKCHGVEHVNVMLRHGDGDELLDLTSEAAAPILNVTSMVVRPIEVPDRYLVASVSALLMRLPCLRSLTVKIYGTKRVALESLEEVEITGFTGADEEMKLVDMLFESSNSIKRMARRG